MIITYIAYVADGKLAERVQWQVCMTHMRRKFVEAALVNERSQCFVNLIDNLYLIESMIKLKQLSTTYALTFWKHTTLYRAW